MNITLQEIKDVCKIYEGGDYRATFWNSVDQKLMDIYLSNIHSDDDWTCVELVAFNHKKDTDTKFSDLSNWEKLVSNMSMHNLNNVPVIVTNEHNQQPMHLIFSGSDNENKTVNFTLWYCDSDFHAWKNDLRRVWFYTKSFFKHILHINNE